jgi:SAM-dependent methyltransferase
MESMEMKCRFCKNELRKKFANLGMSPLANSYLKKDSLQNSESFYPLEVFVCQKCLLVQLGKFESPENIFSEYAYFSSFSKTWLKHVEEFSNEMILNYKLNKKSQIIEIASNDGYLLKNFKKKSIPILGIEPAKNIAKIANKNKIPTLSEFFSNELAIKLVKKQIKGDLVIVFNVLPHIPELNNFILGLKKILKEDGVLVIQFSAYLLDLINKKEFDTIYHEHFSYFSLISLERILAKFNLTVFDAEQKDIHGGSLRIFVKHSKNKNYKITKKVQKLIIKERKNQLNKISTYTKFLEETPKIKNDVWKFFIKMKKENKKIVCYGAAAKGNTFLNYCGIGTEEIEYVADISPHKQKLFLPGSHIPIYSPNQIKKTKPDYVIILPWNLREEIMSQLSFIKKWNGKFVTFIPKTRIF